MSDSLDALVQLGLIDNHPSSGNGAGQFDSDLFGFNQNAGNSHYGKPTSSHQSHQANFMQNQYGDMEEDDIDVLLGLKQPKKVDPVRNFDDMDPLQALGLSSEKAQAKVQPKSDVNDALKLLGLDSFDTGEQNAMENEQQDYDDLFEGAGVGAGIQKNEEYDFYKDLGIETGNLEFTQNQLNADQNHNQKDSENEEGQQSLFDQLGIDDDEQEIFELQQDQFADYYNDIDEQQNFQAESVYDEAMMHGVINIAATPDLDINYMQGEDQSPNNHVQQHRAHSNGKIKKKTYPLKKKRVSPRPQRPPEIPRPQTERPKTDRPRYKQNSNIGVSLYEKGLTFLQNKEERFQQLVKEESMQFRPKINPNTYLLTSNKREQVKEKTPEQSPPEKKKRLSLTSQTFTNFLDRNYNYPLDQYAKRVQNTPPERDTPTYECTFRPSLNKNSLEITKAMPKRSLYKRGVEMRQSMEQKVMAHIRKKEVEEEKGCTFQPDLTKTQNISPTRSIVPQVKEVKGVKVGYAQIHSRTSQFS